MIGKRLPNRKKSNLVWFQVVQYLNQVLHNQPNQLAMILAAEKVPFK